MNPSSVSSILAGSCMSMKDEIAVWVTGAQRVRMPRSSKPTVLLFHEFGRKTLVLLSVASQFLDPESTAFSCGSLSEVLLVGTVFMSCARRPSTALRLAATL